MISLAPLVGGFFFLSLPQNIAMKRPSHLTVSRSQLERLYIAAQKMLRHFDLDPVLLNVFSKKQKQILLSTVFEFPSIKAEKEKTVPRKYVENIRENLVKYMKTNYFGNPENQLTYMDFAVYGLAFYFAVIIQVNRKRFMGTAQEETVNQIYEKFSKTKIINEDTFEKMFEYLVFQTRSYSQVNFRLYGFNCEFDEIHGKKNSIADINPLQIKIKLTAQNCETKLFTHRNIERKAFRLLHTADGNHKATITVILRSKIFPDTIPADSDDYFSIYIQSHVLHRFKERVDIFDPKYRNFLIQYSFTAGQKVVFCEKQILLACTIESAATIGYFTFFLKGDDIVINTFIPLMSEITPEGKKLHELLPLEKEDIIYLGMDKISFLTEIDFEQIPALKQILVDSNIWKTKEVLDSTWLKDISPVKRNIDMNKTIFVKNFFDKIVEE
jgi:hypothetical protein